MPISSAAINPSPAAAPAVAPTNAIQENSEEREQRFSSASYSEIPSFGWDQSKTDVT